MTAKDLRHTAFGYLGKNEGQQVNKECRICLSGEDQYHKLVKFCKCAGTIEHVHEECLKEWIMTKINIKTDIVRCELCQEEFKYTTKTHKTFTC